MEKKNKTILTVIIGIIIIALLCVIIFKFWMTFVTAGIAFGIGYYFGYSNHRPKKSA